MRNVAKFFLLVLIVCFVCFSMVASCGDDDGASSDSSVLNDENADAADDDSVDDDDSDEPEFWKADAQGPYHSGAVKNVVLDYARNRALPGTVWYPTLETDGDAMSYLFGLFKDPDAIENALVAPDGPFPLIVFSHGNGSLDFQSFSLMNYLASHGYIVASCSHIGNTAFTSIPDYWAKAALNRPQDMSSLIDQMLAMNADPQSSFYQKIDPDRIGIIGHSYGGYTAITSLGPPIDPFRMVEKCEEIGSENWSGEWSFCNNLTDSDLSYVDHCRPCTYGDDRIKVAIPMAPAFPYLIEQDGLAQIEVPALIMGGQYDDITPAQTQVRLYFEGMNHSETIYWELAQASHFTFSSACEIPVAKLFYDCGPEFIDIQIASGLIETASAAFLGIHLKNDDRYRQYFENAYLNTVPEVTVEKKTTDKASSF